MEFSQKRIAESFKSVEKDFWNIDCLIRMMKELIFKNSFEMHEGDVDTICEILAEKSEKLCKKVENFKKEL